jgi:rare lipoprotein A
VGRTPAAIDLNSLLEALRRESNAGAGKPGVVSVRSRRNRLTAIVVGLASCWIAIGGGAVAGSACGSASWYGLGGRTASGENIVPGALTAAHPTLPFGTQVRVENLSNGRALVVRINDRGPFVRGRMIDVTRAAAERLGFVRAGVVRVRMTVVGGGMADLEDSCGKAGTVRIIANEIPLPRERPEGSFSVRFGYAFLPADQTLGATSLVLELATRAVDSSSQPVADAAPIPRERPTRSFSARFGYAFLQPNQNPGARSLARRLAQRTVPSRLASRE